MPQGRASSREAVECPEEITTKYIKRIIKMNFGRDLTDRPEFAGNLIAIAESAWPGDTYFLGSLIRKYNEKAGTSYKSHAPKPISIRP